MKFFEFFERFQSFKYHLIKLIIELFNKCSTLINGNKI